MMRPVASIETLAGMFRLVTLSRSTKSLEVSVARSSGALTFNWMKGFNGTFEAF